MNYQRLLLENLSLVDQTVRFVGRRHRLSAEELEELASSVRVKLLEKDCEVLRKFAGRSSLRTYLITVVTRHFLDERTARWGKWRPCAQARRLGPIGLLLDRLMNRDGYTFDEAVSLLQTTGQTPLSERELADISQQLPARSRRRFVDENELEHVPAGVSPSTDPDQPSDDEGVHFERSLAAALERVEPQDRLLLRLRFMKGLQVSEIGRLMQLDAKPLYRRLEQVTSRLRRDLEEMGVRAESALALLDRDAVDVQRLLESGDGESAPARPSTP